MSEATDSVVPTEPGWYWARYFSGPWMPTSVMDGLFGKKVLLAHQGNLQDYYNVKEEFWTWGARIPDPAQLAAMQAELAALREETRWRKWPEEKPVNNLLCAVWFPARYGGVDRVGFDWFSVEDGYWMDCDGDATFTHWRPIVAPKEGA